MRTILFLIVILISFSMFAQNKNVTWDYPVKPGSEEWKSLATGEEMKDVCQIPVEVLSRLNTIELAEICLNYPLRIEYMASNDEREAIKIMTTGFNGLQELYRRKDSSKVLMDLYNNYSTNSLLRSVDDIVFELPFLELLMSESQFVDKLNNEELMSFGKEILRKYEEKVQNSHIYSLYNLKKTLLLGAIVKCKQVAITRSNEDYSVLEQFINDFNRADPELLTEVSKIISTL